MTTKIAKKKFREVTSNSHSAVQFFFTKPVYCSDYMLGVDW
jgi:hypothetical protein